MIASYRRGIASSLFCTATTSSMACCKASIGFPPAVRRIFHCASTSCHKSAANKKAGETGFSCRTRSSAFFRASTTKRSPNGCSSMTSSIGRRPWCSPRARKSTTQANACPDSSNFSISSNNRDGGTLRNNGARSPMGAALASSICIASLAAKRTARNILTGSSR